jgi:hypothetical protein
LIGTYFCQPDPHLMLSFGEAYLPSSSTSTLQRPLGHCTDPT